jgi:hypothetical protein
MTPPFKLTVILAVLTAGSAAAAPSAGVEFFESKIRPVLANHCYECHSVESANRGKLKAGLFLDSRAGLRKGGDTGPAIIPGNAQESLLIKALHQEGPEMPPNGALPETVIADFIQWINAGATDPRDKVPTVLEESKKVEAGHHWAFQPLQDVTPPVVAKPDWVQSPLDQFILHRLEKEDLIPVKGAPARTLVRRIYFDLLGLPPSPEEVAEFLRASEKDEKSALISLVDRLLESPHYGERWGRHWLDVARYAEDQAHTFGVKKRANAHQYRDWVIRMLNEDLPFDQFIKLQLAGDLIAPKSEDPFRQFAGLGFLGLGAQYYKNSDKAKAEADELDDTIDTLTRGFMGLTVSCARCHDHKFDPISIKDYYALAGIFQGRRYTEIPLASADEVKAYQANQKVIKDKESEIRNNLRGIGKKIGRKQLDQVGRYFREGWKLAYLKSNKSKYSFEAFCTERDLHPYFAKRFQDLLDPNKKENLIKRFPELQTWHDSSIESGDMTNPVDLEIPQAIATLVDKMQSIADETGAAFSRMERELREELSQARGEEDRMNRVMRKLAKEEQRFLKNIWFDGHGPFYVAENETRKLFLDEEQLAWIEKNDAELEKLKKNAVSKYPVAHGIQGGGRAMQVYLRGNPATKGDWVARGNLELISSAPRPSEAEAAKKVEYTRLDLAEEIADPGNPLTARVIVNRVWQWHFGKGLVGTASNFGVLGDTPTHPRLLDWLTGQFIKNGWSLKWLHRQILTSSTYQLSSEGNSANREKDPDNRLRWRFDRRRLEVEAWRDALLVVSGELDRAMGGPTLELKTDNNRRTVYGSISRHQLNGMLRIFDFPDANVSAAKRTQTTVPQQQLFVLNSAFIIEQAKALAKRVSAKSSDLNEQITLVHQLAFGRNPSSEELRVARSFLTTEIQKEDKLSGWEQYCQAILASNELMYLE